MKKIICFVILITLTLASLLFTQESTTNIITFKNGFSIGGAGTGTGYGAHAGMIEFGFGLVKKGNFYMRNHIGIEGGYVYIDDLATIIEDDNAVAKSMGYLGFRERIIFGGNMPIWDGYTNSESPYFSLYYLITAIRMYGVIDFGFLMIGGEGKSDISKAPFILDPRAGIGFEMVYGGMGSIFFEILGGYKVFTTGSRVSEEANAYVSVLFGGRGYIN